MKNKRPFTQADFETVIRAAVAPLASASKPGAAKKSRGTSKRGSVSGSTGMRRH